MDKEPISKAEDSKLAKTLQSESKRIKKRRIEARHEELRRWFEALGDCV